MSPIEITRPIERAMIASCVPLLIYVGYRLFSLGATGGMNLSASKDKLSGRLTNISPGVMCFLCAAVLGYIVFSSPVSGPAVSDGADGTTKHESRWTFLSGSADQDPPSVVIKGILAEYALCVTESQPAELCTQQRDQQLKRMPLRDELRQMRSYEQRIATDERDSDAKTQLTKLVQQLLRQ